jgi:hypothetical protein
MFLGNPYGSPWDSLLLVQGMNTTRAYRVVKSGEELWAERIFILINGH